MCIDPTLSVALGDKPPPLYICEECSQRIAGYASASPPSLSPRILPLLHKVAIPNMHPLQPASLFHTLTQGKYITMVTQFPRADNEIIITKPRSHLFLFSPAHSIL